MRDTVVKGLSALKITPLGEIERVELPRAEVLAAYYRHIDCDTVDVVRLHNEIDMWVDDEGMVNGSLVNLMATYVAQRFGFREQPYFGTVVFTGGADREGNSRSLTVARRNEIEGMAAFCSIFLIPTQATREPEVSDATGDDECRQGSQGT